MIIKFIRKETVLFIWFFVSILTIATQILLNNTKELFPLGAELGMVLSSLAQGYLISYVFYFLVVFLKTEKDKKNVSEFIVSKLSIITINAYRVFNSLKINSHIKTLSFPPSEEDLDILMKKLDPVNSICQKGNGKRYNWYEYFKYVIADESIAYINEVWKFFYYLDTELIKIITSLKESKMFQAAYGISHEIIPTNESSINVHNDKSVSQRLAEYFRMIYEIENYLIKNFPEYVEHEKERKNELYHT